MHHELRTEVEIAAPMDDVWRMLTDLAAYRDWNPFIISAEGWAEVGQRLTNRIRPPGGRAITLQADRHRGRAGRHSSSGWVTWDCPGSSTAGTASISLRVRTAARW